MFDDLWRFFTRFTPSRSPNLHFYSILYPSSAACSAGLHPVPSFEPIHHSHRLDTGRASDSYRYSE
jgi:hypothetical protein